MTKFVPVSVEMSNLPIKLSLGTATAQHKKLSEAFVVADQRMYSNKAQRKASANYLQGNGLKKE